MPCSAATSRKASQFAEQAVVGGAQAGAGLYNFGAQGAERLSNWLEERYGMSRNERLMLYGVALGAPLALFAAPLLGIGLAGALAAPGLRDFIQGRKEQHSGSAASSVSHQAVSQAVAPLAPVAHQVIDQDLAELQQRVAEQNETLQSLIALCRKQQEEINRLQAGNSSAAASEAGPGSKKKQERQNPGKLQALLSLPIEESEQVLSGQQQLLFRNGRMKIDQQQRLAIYGKQPAKEIQGTVVAEQVVSGTPEQVWEQIGADSGLDHQEFAAACQQAMTEKSKTVSVVRLSEPQKLADPIPFKNSGLTSYDLNGICYLKPEEHARHQQVIHKIIQLQKQKPTINA